MFFMEGAPGSKLIFLMSGRAEIITGRLESENFSLRFSLVCFSQFSLLYFVYLYHLTVAINAFTVSRPIYSEIYSRVKVDTCELEMVALMRQT
jgi:hypothetical protein